MRSPNPVQLRPTRPRQPAQRTEARVPERLTRAVAEHADGVGKAEHGGTAARNHRDPGEDEAGPELGQDRRDADLEGIASPLSSPPTAPTPSNAARPSAIAGAACAVCGSGAKLRITSTASMEERFARPITERSMPPVSIDTITASPRMANSGNWNAIDEKFACVKNRLGSAALMPTNTRTVISARRPRLVSSKRRGQFAAEVRTVAACSVMGAPPSPLAAKRYGRAAQARPCRAGSGSP